MALHWLRQAHNHVVTSNSVANNVELITPTFYDDNHLTIVDGIFLMGSDSDDLWVVRLVHTPELIGTADLTASQPDGDDRMNYYYWHVNRGPILMRLRSKKTLFEEESLWLQSWKISGTSQQELNVGIQIGYVVH